MVSVRDLGEALAAGERALCAQTEAVRACGLEGGDLEDSLASRVQVFEAGREGLDRVRVRVRLGFGSGLGLGFGFGLGEG